VGSAYVITQAIDSQAGALWSNSKVSLNTSFTISAELFFGAYDDGADGFSFIIQNQSKTLIGASGGGLGYQGIANSVAIEFDTYNNDAEYNDIPHDHAAFDVNGSMNGLGAPIDLGNIEDGHYHPVTIDWNAATHLMTLSYNGSVIGRQTIDVAAIVGSGEAYIGFAGSTGAADNLQMIRDLTYQSADNSVVLDVLVNDTDVDDGDRATLHVVSATSAGGASVTFSGSPGAGIVYSPGGVFDYLAAGQTATDTVTYTIQDSHRASSTTTAQVTIHGLNDAPTLTATAANPSFTEAPERGTQAAPVAMFSGAHSSAIDDGQAITGLTFKVSGLVDGANERVIVDGTTIALGSPSTGSTSSGLTFGVAIAGGTATVTLSSAGGISAAAANTLVNSIAYQDSSADAPTAGDRTFTLTQITDNGGTHNTTALSIASTVHLVAVNDAPVFTGHDLELGYVASGAAVALVDGVSSHDIDSADYAGGSLTATVTAGGHEGDTLSIANGEFISVTTGHVVMYDSDGVGGPINAIAIGNLANNSGHLNSVTVSLNGNATDAAVEALAQAIQFANGKQDAAAGLRTVTFALHDGGGTANGGHDSDYFVATVNVTAAANHDPVANDDTLALPAPSGEGWVLNPGTGHYYRLVASNVSWTEANTEAQSDGAYLATITSQAEQNFIHALTCGVGGWLGGYSADASQVATWQWAAGPETGTHLDYQNWNCGEPSGWEFNPPEGLHLEGDGGWNDVPADWRSAYIEEWGGRPGDANVGENSTLMIATSTLLGNDTDPDAGNQPTIFSVSASAGGALVTVSGSTISYDPTHAAKLQALAAGETTTDTFTYTVSDNHGGTDTATVTLVVAGINDAPVFTGHDLEPGYVASGAAVALVDCVSAHDIDSADYAGGSLTATVTENFHVGDSLTIADGDTIFVSSGSYVMFDADGAGCGAGAIEIGTLSGGGTSLTVTLNVSANNAAVEALTEAIRFETSDSASDTRTVTFTLNDGDGTANGGHDFTRFDTTVRIDHTPVIVTDNLQIGEHAGATTISGLSVSDADATSTEIFTITETTSGVGSGSVTPPSGSGSLANINTTLDNGVTYHPGSTPSSTGMVTVTDGFGATDTVNFIFNQTGTGPVTLQGTAGKDVIFATGYDDTLTGGASSDQFVFTANTGHDTITDFMPGHDRIELDLNDAPFVSGDQGSFNAWINYNGAVEQLGNGDTQIHLEGGNSILLSNVDRSSLHMNDFILHPGGGPGT
jgi:VCBS repeat-containing protein